MTQRVPISGEDIKLGQFLKLANLVESGGQAKEAIASAEVTVDGEASTQRGLTLRPGQIVCLGGQCVEVAGPEEDDFFDEATANDDFDPEKWRNL
ncbi:RNA-binding S4 domain-containing protein [Corynebacterium tapiri]|uniref:RNA-binding S4 domain-containing protein n=1 Tax=Corynebacterium tapiri TaxID=1448266 RepID=A0A5C4U482_9CORY|nr:RNA-binding S4 domain-containing protein [Corynebacterium tapiri]TNL96780.1 RNA-binding S4 domain-containing protein [Corynebacterium tapiri]